MIKVPSAHSEWLGGGSKALTEMRCVVNFEVIPGDGLSQLDLAGMIKKSAVKR